MSGIYDVWISLALGAASTKTVPLCESFGSAKELFEAGEREWRMCPELSPKNISKMLCTGLDDAKDVISRCEKCKIKIVSCFDDGYPKMLGNIPQKPFLLYIKGDAALLSEDRLFAAVVGTREPGEYGADCAETLSASLASNGAVIVSGGAKGIDTVSHKAALKAGGKTVCVLGCGTEYPYLRENAEMRREISESGALVSEYPPDMPASKYSFIVRNRIISGLSHATVVVEAGEKSGALATAKYAREQGRELFAVTGGMFSPSFAGSNGLLKNGEAAAVFSAKEIFDKTGFKMKARKSGAVNTEMNEKPKKGEKISFEKPKAPECISDAAKKVYSSFIYEEMELQELIGSSKLPPNILLSALSELEINGIVSAFGGGKYRFIIRKQVK
ncbi:MAG: DNA-processing protein DprA [Acutalibacteraceae bacterium]